MSRGEDEEEKRLEARRAPLLFYHINNNVGTCVPLLLYMHTFILRPFAHK